MAFCSSDHEIRGLSLCAGVAGLDLGLHIAESRYRTVCFVERQSFAAAALVARMADTSLAAAPVWDDLKSFDGKAWRGKVHIISAGYPCQPFTLSGKRKGDADPRHLWPEVRRIVDEVRPGRVFFENVPGHITLGFRDVVRDLQGMGYRVATMVVSAAETGATHTRERLFILGDTDVSTVRQSGLHPPVTGGDAIPAGRKPKGDADRNPQSDRGVADDVGPGPSHGLAGAEIPLYPPLPGDFAEWRKTLRAFPEIEPAVHRLADGMADRVERCAAAGNGVVPLAAAYAYRTLSAALNGD